MATTGTWRRVTEEEPREFSTVYLYREGDLFPAVGFRICSWQGGADIWRHEDAGAEDGEHQSWRPIGGEGWSPTHWQEIGKLPGWEL